MFITSSLGLVLKPLPHSSQSTAQLGFLQQQQCYPEWVIDTAFSEHQCHEKHSTGLRDPHSGDAMLQALISGAVPDRKAILLGSIQAINATEIIAVATKLLLEHYLNHLNLDIQYSLPNGLLPSPSLCHTEFGLTVNANKKQINISC